MQAKRRVSYEHTHIRSNLTGIFVKDLETKVKNNQLILNSFQLLVTKTRRGLATSNDIQNPIMM